MVLARIIRSRVCVEGNGCRRTMASGEAPTTSLGPYPLPPVSPESSSSCCWNHPPASSSPTGKNPCLGRDKPRPRLHDQWLGRKKLAQVTWAFYGDSSAVARGMVNLSESEVAGWINPKPPPVPSEAPGVGACGGLAASAMIPAMNTATAKNVNGIW